MFQVDERVREEDNVSNKGFSLLISSLNIRHKILTISKKTKTVKPKENSKRVNLQHLSLSRFDSKKYITMCTAFCYNKMVQFQQTW